MSLNIKSDETHELTRELAQLTGESLTQAVTTAVQERLERVRREHGDTQLRAQALLAIGRDTAPRLREPTLRTEHGELLYDDRGLPR
ncbi:MAG: type II toxin-antitoxin system VapB family antitoxin [Pseudonocardiaceae bacterium]